MTIEDQVKATLKRRSAKNHQSAMYAAYKRTRQQQLNDNSKNAAKQRILDVLQEHRPDITLVRYYDARTVTLECRGLQQTFEAKYIKTKVDRLFGGAH